MTTKKYTVTGMTCAGCVRTVQRILQNQPGVQQVDVSLDQSEAKITFDETQISAEQLHDALAKIGYALVVA
jgi:copper chaperone CopZ